MYRCYTKFRTNWMVNRERKKFIYSPYVEDGFHINIFMIFTANHFVFMDTLCRLRFKCDGTCAETRFRLSVKWTSPFKSAGGAPVQSTTGSRDVPISGSNAGYNMFRGSVKSTCYPLHLPVSPSLPLPCVTVCHHISTGL
jgi:hypothetical protein